MGYGGGGSGISTPQTKILVLIEAFTAGGAGASKVFNLPTAYDAGSEITEWLLVIDGSVTAALELRMRINGSGAAQYRSWGSRQIATTGAVTDLTTGIVAYNLLVDATALDAANLFFMGEVKLQVQNTGAPTGNYASMRSYFFTQGSASQFSQVMTGISDALAVQETITSIEILTSTSTWRAGTRFWLYGIKRVDS